ncbi:YeeE/YedE family protein [Salinisphaera sp. T31B1]|uniref:YeeE/YedE family protein n=1 Tax=Salinisphaera sp. T31B1 TaxID=727963 RepID=UPI00333EDF7C
MIGLFTGVVDFTPISALAGGVLIGAAAALLWLGLGRIAGISGMVHALVGRETGSAWRGWFLAGLIVSAAVFSLIWPEHVSVRAGFPAVWLVIAGVLVGIGTRMGNGCTSGHGVCGIGRGSRRSLTATAVFMLAGILTAVLTRHVLGIGS